ncbi:nuclear transport factor 2 family protein [Streptomyces sp. NRRL S-1813]|uniref:nuclear transport factor 2 family protein n=1 Tax=Streptomyces sp. NRRL S-1813 TaxID=1463888 RepID=UPI001F404142|nr:nuclear transport factor 2 family protein [Streptomyces sp. NRRL S-1813]
MDAVTGPEIERRLARVEAHLAIQQLAFRYALAVDARDLDAWVGCFHPDVDMGRAGRGRDVLRHHIAPMLRTFHRSVHHITGHRIEWQGTQRATGTVYCRAEHEVDDRWIVMAICYFDDYACVDGEWLFTRRRERHWYAADVTDRPQAVGFADWPPAGHPALPHSFPTWQTFWGDDAPVPHAKGHTTP